MTLAFFAIFWIPKDEGIEYELNPGQRRFIRFLKAIKKVSRCNVTKISRNGKDSSENQKFRHPKKAQMKI